MKRSLLVAILLLGGCSTERWFQPSPPEYKVWRKEGMTELDVRKKFLECGATFPDGDSHVQTINESAMITMCVESAGFDRVDYYTGRPNPLGWCRNWPDLPACQPGAEIPAPSVERRLNSHYCKMRTSFDFCYNRYMSGYSDACKSKEYPYYNRRGDLVWNTVDDCLKMYEEKTIETCGSAHYRLSAECLP